MVEKKTRAKKAKGGCLVGLKGVGKGCKVGRTAPRNVGKEGMVKKKTKPLTKGGKKPPIKLKIPAPRMKKPELKLKIPASRMKQVKLKVPASRLATAKSEDTPAKRKAFAEKYKKNRGKKRLGGR